MPTPGYVFKDGGPIPDDELQGQRSSLPGLVTSSPRESAPLNKSMIDATASSQLTPASGADTDSHALAAVNHDEKGAAQQRHTETEVRDLGWQEHPKDVPKPLVGGLPNDDLWLLVRRFNKQIYHVKATPVAPMGRLDLYTADEDEFSPDKLRANIERLYMTVIVGLISLGKHIARLRSWRERRRTSAFALTYFIAWAFNFIVPLLLTTLVVLIVYPPARDVMFPPAPIALVDASTGGVQSPKAGVLGSHNSLTGAPEKHHGEAVEQEAHNFVSGIGTIAMSSATGKHDQSDPKSDSLSKSVPDPTKIAAAGADAKGAASYGKPNKLHDKTKEPMEEVMWAKMRPIMHVIGDIADGWERFANALSPTPPFPQEAPRLKLAGLLVPVIALSLLTTSFMFVKTTTFFVGFGFFGDPVISRGVKWLDRKFPHWQKLLEIRNTILKGVPTNAQLTITLLRIGEANRAPLPPPPRSDEPPPDHPAELRTDELTLDASHDDIHDAIHADVKNTTLVDRPNDQKKKHGSRVLNFLKGTAKAGVETKLGADKLLATVGSTEAKEHLGVLPTEEDRIKSGPVAFKGRYQGKKGWVYINTSATIPCVSFSTHESNGTGEQSEQELHPIFSIPIQEITELKKVGGMGWKAKLVVGWATDKTILDGIEITDRYGKKWHITALALRDELFNRLVAMGGQKWESW